MGRWGFGWVVRFLVLLGVGLGVSVAWAGAMTPDEAAAIGREAQKAAVVGPAEVPVAGQGLLKLPEGYTWVPQPHAQKVLHAMGNPGEDPKLQGLIFPPEGGEWAAIVSFEESGYIKDDDAREWKTDEMLESYRSGTLEANKDRAEMGIKPIEIVGWAQVPAYDSATHRLVWAMSTRHVGAAADEPQGVNYNTFVLGREGYFSLNLITELKDLPLHKSEADRLLAALNFDEGKRYGDFNSATDKVAEYGLAALVIGAAVKKLGLLAMLMVFLAKFGKIFAVAAVGGWAVFRKFFRRGDKSDAAGSTAASGGSSPPPPAA